MKIWFSWVKKEWLESLRSGKVLLGTGGVVLAFYLLGLIPKLSAYMPTKLWNGSTLLFSGSELGDYGFAVGVSVVLMILCLVLSVMVMNRRKI